MRLRWCGGIVGYADGGEISNCSVLKGSDITGNLEAGGIAGYLGEGATLEKCIIEQNSFIEANEESKGAAGGIVGHLNESTLKNDKAYTTIDGRAKYKGKIVGLATGMNTINGNYFLADMGSATHVVAEVQELEGISDGASDDGATEHAAETVTNTDPANDEETEKTETKTDEKKEEEVDVVEVTPEVKLVPQVGTYDNNLTFSFGTLVNLIINQLESKSTFIKELSEAEKIPEIFSAAKENYIDRKVEDVTEEESADIAKAGETIILVLPAISVDHAAIYVYKTLIPESTNLPVGAEIFLHVSSKLKSEVTISSFGVAAADEDEIAMMIDDSGDELKVLPEDRYVNISGYMDADHVYYPIITTKVSKTEVKEEEKKSEEEKKETEEETDDSDDEDDDEDTDSDEKKSDGDGGSGGCETGFGILGLVAFVGALGLKKSWY